MNTRRHFLQQTAALSLGLTLADRLLAAPKPRANLQFGLVTYLWGRDWDVPTLIANCEKAGIRGVELRSTHAHGVEPTLTAAQRADVRKRFEDSRVTFVGIGSDERFDSPDPAKLQKAIDAAKAYIQLSHDCGGSGVKVKPDRFWDGVPREKTIEQIGKSLNVLGEFAAGYGQQVRLEIHGQCAELPTIKAIMDVATNENVGLCWNCNKPDLAGDGLEANFQLVRKRFGETLHIHELQSADYPYAKLISLLVETNYAGWVLMENASQPADRVAAMAEQLKLFQDLVAKAAGK